MKQISPYTVDCLIRENEADGILYPGASSFPGSKTLKYYPLNKMPYELRLDPNCVKAFTIPIIWKSKERNTELFRNVSHRLTQLPLEKGSKVVYMQESKGYFFDLKLEDGIRLTITQYEDESENGAYVNVIMDGEVLVQDFMSIDDIVSAMKEYYHGGES